MVPYQDKAGAVESHYVVLEDEAGHRQKIWGADLPRALEDGQIKRGEQTALAFRGQKTVTISVKVPSEDGKGVRLEKRDVERNAWEAVQLDRLRETVRAKVGRQVRSSTRPGPLPERASDPLAVRSRQRER